MKHLLTLTATWSLLCCQLLAAEPRLNLILLMGAERSDLIAQQPATAARFQSLLHDWQQSVLQSLTGADYLK